MSSHCLANLHELYLAPRQCYLNFHLCLSSSLCSLRLNGNKQRIFTSPHYNGQHLIRMECRPITIYLVVVVRYVAREDSRGGRCYTSWVYTFDVQSKGTADAACHRVYRQLELRRGWQVREGLRHLYQLEVVPDRNAVRHHVDVAIEGYEQIRMQVTLLCTHIQQIVSCGKLQVYFDWTQSDSGVNVIGALIRRWGRK